MNDFENILNDYKNEIKQNPVFAELISNYSQDRLKVYLILSEYAQNEELPQKTRELFFAILNCFDGDAIVAKAHAIAAIEAGLTMEELIQEFAITAIALDSDDLYKIYGEVIETVKKAAE